MTYFRSWAAQPGLANRSLHFCFCKMTKSWSVTSFFPSSYCKKVVVIEQVVSTLNRQSSTLKSFLIKDSLLHLISTLSYIYTEQTEPRFLIRLQSKACSHLFSLVVLSVHPPANLIILPAQPRGLGGGAGTASPASTAYGLRAGHFLGHWDVEVNPSGYSRCDLWECSLTGRLLHKGKGSAMLHDLKR